ncbi:hypothetical protein [Streptomyces sp. bgisy154]|uniref:hypothetical protein n=1 Tax=Streptomyces sp. bgisy154 TaxID=3413794 RepID=UPI003D744B03
MSHQPNPQQPRWNAQGAPPQPGWGPPRPPAPQPPKKNQAGKFIGLGCLGVVALFIVAGIIGTVTGAGDDDKQADPKPPYEVVQQDTNGNKRTIVVEVNTTKDLRSVFDAVTTGLKDEAGYYIMINCSTGGTKSVDNRLANGQYAIGRLGEATTGLNDGDTEFSTNKGRTCPVSAADEAQQKADQEAAATAAGLPPDPDAATREAYLDALNAIDPRIAKPGKDDQTVSRGLTQCRSIKEHPNDKGKLAQLALERFTVTTRLPEISTPETGQKIVDAVHKHLCPTF